MWDRLKELNKGFKEIKEHNTKKAKKCQKQFLNKL